MFSSISLLAGQITDDFKRSDRETIGNGWIEKNSTAFVLLDGKVVKHNVSTGYRDNICYRPASENLLDVEASVEFSITARMPGYPQLHVRVQTDNVREPHMLHSYILIVDDSNRRAVLGRQRGDKFVTRLAKLAIDPPLNVKDTYRLRLRVQGTNPVHLSASIDRKSDGVWHTNGNASAEDSDAMRIASPGSVGFSGYLEAGYTYDNFVRTVLRDGSPDVDVRDRILPATRKATTE